jgi:transcription antitermination factor NusG
VASQQWHAVRWTPGIAALVMHADAPAQVSDAVIDGLRARERNGLVVLPPPLDPSRINRGDLVRVTRGVLTGFHGPCTGLAPHERVTILLSLLGARRPVTLAASDVVAVR